MRSRIIKPAHGKQDPEAAAQFIMIKHQMLRKEERSLTDNDGVGDRSARNNRVLPLTLIRKRWTPSLSVDYTV